MVPSRTLLYPSASNSLPSSTWLSFSSSPILSVDIYHVPAHRLEVCRPKSTNTAQARMTVDVLLQVLETKSTGIAVMLAAEVTIQMSGKVGPFVLVVWTCE